MKKKLLSLILCLCVVFAFSGVADAATATIKVDGAKIASEVAPINANGTILVPLTVISNAMGADTSWNQTSRQATLKSAAYTVVFTVDSKECTVNGVKKTLTAAPQLVDSRVLVPIRAFSQFIGATVGWSQSTSTVTVDYFTKMKGTLKISGSTTLQPVAQAAADKLMKMNSGLSITVAGGGSGAGIKDATAGTNDIGMSSRELTAEEAAVLGAYAVARDGIAIIVNPNNKVTSLTKDQASKIFLGEIKNWNEVGGANAPILVQTRETGSGTRSTLEELLLAKKSVVATATPFASSQLIKQAVAKNANAIGFDSVGYVDSTVKAVTLEGKAASTANVKNKTYPMGRELFIVSKGAPSGLAAMFIDYLRCSDVQKNIVVKEGYIELN
jgi:phosphate transport system substrate-binding protein